MNHKFQLKSVPNKICLFVWRKKKNLIDFFLFSRRHLQQKKSNGRLTAKYHKRSFRQTVTELEASSSNSAR